MDNTDIKIINLLRKNARSNASEIAEKIKLSVSAVIERMKKLEASGFVLGYTVLLDHSKIGKDVIAMMSISIEHPKYNDAFEAAVIQNPNITECHYVAGDFDYLLKVITDNTKSLEKVLNEIKSLQGVSKTKTSIVFSSPKNEFSVDLKAKNR
ncbi:MAG: Lrp/AsnC family transcriptional regulator [Clostridia bacterium]|nr:Lrp/AsnC family transcriptional regulator [Clostridia bacterium]